MKWIGGGGHGKRDVGPDHGDNVTLLVTRRMSDSHSTDDTTGVKRVASKNLCLINLGYTKTCLSSNEVFIALIWVSVPKR